MKVFLPCPAQAVLHEQLKKELSKVEQESPMNSLTSKLNSLGHQLPEPRLPEADFIPQQIVGNLLIISGQVCQWQGERRYTGKLGKELDLETGIKAAQLCGLNILTWVREAIDDDLNRIRRCVRLGGFVSSTPEFTEQAKVISACSKLMVDVFDEAGRHNRSSVGVAVLPFDFSVMVEATFELNV